MIRDRFQPTYALLGGDVVPIAHLRLVFVRITLGAVEHRVLPVAGKHVLPAAVLLRRTLPYVSKDDSTDSDSGTYSHASGSEGKDQSERDELHCV